MQRQLPFTANGVGYAAHISADGRYRSLHLTITRTLWISVGQLGNVIRVSCVNYDAVPEADEPMQLEANLATFVLDEHHNFDTAIDYAERIIRIFQLDKSNDTVDHAIAASRAALTSAPNRRATAA